MAKTTLCWDFPEKKVRNTMISAPRIVHTRGNSLPPLLSIEQPNIPMQKKISLTYKAVERAHFLNTTVAFKKKTAVGKPRSKKPAFHYQIKGDTLLQDTVAT